MTARRRTGRLAVAASLAGLCLIGLCAPGAFGGYIAKVANSSDTAATAAVFPNCTNVAATSTFNTPATIAYSLGDSTGTAAENLVAAAQTGIYKGTVTRPVANDAPGAVCGHDSRTVVTFDGTSGWIAANASAPKLSSGPFSLEVWFKTTAAQGRLIGYGDTKDAASSRSDRHLYIGTDGKLYFGIQGYYSDYYQPKVVQASTTAVTDGVWHNAIATYNSSYDTALYLDGTAVGSSQNVFIASNAAYLHVGWDQMSGWTNQNTTTYGSYFKGQMAFASVYNYALTAAQALTHYKAGR